MAYPNSTDTIPADTPPTDLSQSSSKTSLRDGTDSGYATAATNTPIKSGDASQCEVELPTGNILRRKTTRLKVFDREIPSHVQSRYLDLNELYEKSLCEHLSKKRISTSNISVKLKVLGESEATIGYCYVVMCEEKAVKRVRQFFNQQHVKSEFQSRKPTTNQPYFRIWVCSRPPRVMAADAIVEIREDAGGIISTLCGRAIRVESRMAKIGGVIKVITHEKGTMLYAMTAGHVFAKDPADQDTTEEESSDYEEVDGDCDDPFSVEDFEFDLAIDEEEDISSVQLSVRDESSRPNQPEVEESAHAWSAIGSEAIVASNHPRKERNLDWAVIEMDDPSMYRPNLFVLPDTSRDGIVIGSEFKEVSRRSMRVENGRKVVMLTGMGGVKCGRLSAPTSLLMTGRVKHFAQTYSVELCKGSALEVGDCGSWVIDDTTHELYGHVVASDMFGEAYVIPLKATLQDIEDHFMAESVCLPTTDEVRGWVKGRNRVRPARPALLRPCGTVSIPTGAARGGMNPPTTLKRKLSTFVKDEPHHEVHELSSYGDAPLIHQKEQTKPAQSTRRKAELDTAQDPHKEPIYAGDINNDFATRCQRPASAASSSTIPVPASDLSALYSAAAKVAQSTRTPAIFEPNNRSHSTAPSALDILRYDGQLCGSIDPWTSTVPAIALNNFNYSYVDPDFPPGLDPFNRNHLSDQPPGRSGHQQPCSSRTSQWSEYGACHTPPLIAESSARRRVRRRGYDSGYSSLLQTRDHSENASPEKWGPIMSSSSVPLPDFGELFGTLSG